MHFRDLRLRGQRNLDIGLIVQKKHRETSALVHLYTYNYNRNTDFSSRFGQQSKNSIN